jgi:hypothetical protein
MPFLLPILAIGAITSGTALAVGYGAERVTPALKWTAIASAVVIGGVIYMQFRRR